ncbi:MAG: branched-chain amino acid ABC transporter substrate-binding protein [Actinomycetota bacterium]
MSWMTSLPVLAIFFLSLLIVGSVSAVSYLILHSKTGDHRERTGMAAAAYMTALGSLFAILTGFLINSEYATLRQAQSLVGKEAAAASRLAWSSETLPSVDTALVQQRLGVYLSDSRTSDFKAFGSSDEEATQNSAAFESLRELQSISFTIASRPYVDSATSNAMEESMAELTNIRRDLLSIAGTEMPIELLLLSTIAGFALIINALFVALRSGGNIVYVAFGIILIVALDLALVVGISAPFRGPFKVDAGPVATMASEVQSGLYLPWIGPGDTMRPSDDVCKGDDSDCVHIGPEDPVQLAALLRLGSSDASGVDAYRGIELAIDYLDGVFDGSPGQLLNRDVAVWKLDDRCSAEGGRSGAGQLLNDKLLVAAIGTTCSGAAYQAAEPLFSEAGVLLVSAQNTAPILTATADEDRTYFRTAPNDLIQGAVVADFIGGDLGLDRIAVVSDGTVYSDELGTVFEAKVGSYGVELTKSFSVTSLSDFSSLASQLIAGGYQGVYMPVNSPVCEDLMNAIANAPGGNQLAVVTSDACLVASSVSAANRVNAYGSGPDVTVLAKNPFYETEYKVAYRSTFGKEPLSVWNTSAFDAANLVFDAIRRAAIVQPDGSLVLPRRALVEAMRVVDRYEGVSNLLACTPTGDCAQSATIGIFRSPAWPVGLGAQFAQPVFSKTKTLASVVRGK